MSNIENYKKAFTVVELLIVVIVIAIISVLAIVSYSGITEKARISSLQSDLSAGAKKLKLYYSQYGSYPTSLDSNGCPALPTVDSNYCVKLTSGNTISSFTGSASSFTLTISNGAKLYKITESTAPQSATAFNLTLIAGSNGTVSNNSGIYETGTTITITATPNASYGFSSWTGGAGCSGSASHSITITADVTCTANFIIPNGSTTELAQTSGLALKNAYPSLPSGTYWIKSASMANAAQMYIDMTGDGGGWTRISSENTADATGWTNGTITNATVAGVGTAVHGMFAVGDAPQKTYDLLGISHTQARIQGRYYAVDSWDNEPNGAQVWVDGAMVWSQAHVYNVAGPGAGWVTATFSPAPWGNNAHGGNGYWDLQTSLGLRSHTSNSLTLKFATGIDQGVSDESYAFSHVQLWIR